MPGVTGEHVRDPSFGLDALWIDPLDRANAVVAGYTVVDAPTVAATHLNAVLTAGASQLFGLDETQAVLDALKQSHPQLAANLTPQPYPLATIAGVCRALLAERVPLRDFRRVAEALVELAPQALPLHTLVEAVRARIGPLIVQNLVPLRMPLPIMTFDGELEGLLVRSAQAAPDAHWPFEPQLAARIVQAASEAAQPLIAEARSFAIVVAPSIRVALARLLAGHLADIPVLSFAELPETRRVDVLAVIGESAATSTPQLTHGDPA